MLRSAQGYSCVKTEVYFLINTTDKYWYSKFSVSVAIFAAKCSYWKKNIGTVIAAYSRKHRKLKLIKEIKLMIREKQMSILFAKQASVIFSSAFGLNLDL